MTFGLDYRRVVVSFTRQINLYISEVDEHAHLKWNCSFVLLVAVLKKHVFRWEENGHSNCCVVKVINLQMALMYTLFTHVFFTESEKLPISVLVSICG